MQRLLVIVALVLSHYSWSQEFQIQNVYAEKGKVYVNFKIDENLKFEKYKVELYSSHNNFSTPVQEVSGAVEGGEIAATGQNLQIVWNAQKELKEYDGDIQLELRGRVVYTPVHMESDKVAAKQGKVTTIDWEGGKPSDNILIELMRGDRVVETIDNVQNIGAYDWAVSKDLEKTGGYRVKLTNLGNPGESYETDPFKVAGKIGLAVKLSPIAVLGAGAAVLLTGGGTDPGDNNGDGDGGGNGNELPAPPTPGGGGD